MNKNPARFWVPEPSGAVTDDFRRLFDARSIDLDLFLMGSRGNIVMLMKGASDQVNEWSDLEFLGRWRLRTPEECNILKSDDDDIIGSETQFEIDGSRYSLRHALLSAQILGLEVNVYIWPDRIFRPLVFMSDVPPHCGAIAIPNCQSIQTPPPAVQLEDVATRTDSNGAYNLLPLTPQQMRQIETSLDLPADPSSNSLSNLLQDLPMAEKKAPTNDTREAGTSTGYSRKCGDMSCNSMFYCLGECKIEKRVSDPDFCFCPECARKHFRAAGDEEGRCQTRFPELAESGARPKLVVLEPSLFEAIEKSLGLEQEQNRTLRVISARAQAQRAGLVCRKHP